MIGRRSVLLTAMAGLAARSIRAEDRPVDDRAVTRTHGISMLGKPALPPAFSHFPYVNPDAPKGGEVALSAVGTFDSFNGYIIRGNAPSDIGRVYDALLIASVEPASSFSIELPAKPEILWVLRSTMNYVAPPVPSGSDLLLPALGAGFNDGNLHSLPASPKDHKAVARVLVRPCPDVRQRAKPVDARERPEVDDDDLSP